MSSLDEWRHIALASLGLPDKRLLDVLKLVEQAPDRSRVRVVLDQIRPRLARLRPPRLLTAQRLLFRPVEDLFDPAERYRAKIGRLSRTIIHPCWMIVTTLVPQPLLKNTEIRLRNIDPLDHKDVFAAGLQLWGAASAQLSAFLATDTSIGRRQVGPEQITITEDIRRQLSDIADVLGIAPEIEMIKLHLPDRPIRSLARVDVDLLSTTVTRLTTDSTEKVRIFIQVLLARMARPGDLLQVLAGITLPCSATEQTDLFKAVGSKALAALTNEAQELRRHRNTLSDPVAGAHTAEQLVNRLTSLERTLDGLRDHAVTDQIQSVRREIGTFVVDTVMVKADQELFKNLSPASTVEASPQPPTVEQVEHAETCALSLRRCGQVAKAVGMRKEVDQKLSAICTELERRSAASDPDGNELIRSVRLIELIAGPEEAQRILMTHMASP